MENQNINPTSGNINNTIPEQNTTPPAPTNTETKDPKTKKIFILTLVAAFLILIIPGSITYYILNREDEKATGQEEIMLQEEEENLFQPEDEMIVEEFNHLDLYTEKLQEIMGECISETDKNIMVEDKNLFGNESQYEGMLWLNENIELIKNYSTVNLQVEQDQTNETAIRDKFEQCIDRISNFVLSENFDENYLNTYDNSMEGFSINRNTAFEKEDIKISLHYSDWELKAYIGDIQTANTSREFQEIYFSMVPERDFAFDVELHTTYDNYALVSFSNFMTAWDTILERDPTGLWEQSLTLYQYLPPCEEFVQANIPPELFDNAPAKFKNENKECLDENDEPQHYHEYMRDRIDPISLKMLSPNYVHPYI